MTAQLPVCSHFCFSSSSTFPLSVQPKCVFWSCFLDIPAEHGYALYWSVLIYFSFHLSMCKGSKLAIIWPLVKLSGIRVWQILPLFPPNTSWKWNPLETNMSQSNIWTSRFLSSLLTNPACLHFSIFFSPNLYQTPRAGESLLAKSELMDVGIHSPLSVKAITLLFAWFALCGGAIPHGDGSLTQEYAWVEKN